MGDVFLYVVMFFLSLLLLLFTRRDRSRGGLHERLKLPPGSMGLPYIGETLQLYTQNPNVFFANRCKRYGEIFKTNILGCPSVMLANPEAARFVLVTRADLFKPTYPKSKERLLGPAALFYHQGDYHQRLRKLVQSSLSLDSVRSLVNDVNGVVVSALESWVGGHVINTFQEMKKISFEVGILSIFGNLEVHYREELKKNYLILDKGYNSFPINIPWTPYKKALMARKRLGEILSKMIKERREKKLLDKDLLGWLLNSKDGNGNPLSDDEIADNVIGVLFAAQDTTASVMTWILKYLHEDPELLEAVKDEQNAILERNEGGSLTWSQTRNMPLTYRVVLETLRMASIISFTFREAVEDVEYKGYLIRKGWKVLPLFRNIHHNSEFFSDPLNFNPSRFEVAPKPNTFLPFGSGVHVCPGNELAKLEMLVMTHHLVTKYRWEVEGTESGIEYGPFPIPSNGLPARFWKESST